MHLTNTALLTVLLLGSASAAEEQVIVDRATPPAYTNLVGNWFGFAEGDLFIYRLCISASNAVVMVDYANRRLARYPCARVLLDDFRVATHSVGPRESMSLAQGRVDQIRSVTNDWLKITGLYDGMVINAEVSGEKYRRQVIFYSEPEITSRLARLRSLVEAAGTGKPR